MSQLIEQNPLVDFGLKAHGHLYGRWSTGLSDKKEPEEVLMYRCPSCSDLHDDEDDAKYCCSESGVYCPVCASSAPKTYSEAVDCCLWKALPVSKRLSVVDEMEAGKTWTEAISN